MEFKLHYWNYIQNYVNQNLGSINQTLKAFSFCQEITHTQQPYISSQEASNSILWRNIEKTSATVKGKHIFLPETLKVSDQILKYITSSWSIAVLLM